MAFNSRLTGSRRGSALAAAALACGVALAASAAQATVVFDPKGDILDTFILGKNHSDLDVVKASATFTADRSHVVLSSTQAGRVGQTDRGIYVWGIDRGSGIDLLNQEPFANPNDPNRPPVGAGVNFDAFIVLHQDGAADLHLVNIVDGHFAGIGVTTLFTAEDHVVTINGHTISVALDAANLPGVNGRAFKDFTYNVWPRFDRVPDTVLVSDFAPDHSTFGASVPEPATWGLMIMGFGLVGSTLRRRRGALAAA